MRRGGLAVTLAAVAGIALAVVILITRHADGPSPERTALPAARNPASAPTTPQFRQPQQAAQYREAMTEGNQRALLVLRQALDQARAQPNADSKQIAVLEQEIERRRKLLEEVATVR